MKLPLFNGGLNTRLDEKLIAPTEAVVCSNVDTEKGVINSIKGLTETTIVSANKSYYYKSQGEWVDIAGALEYLEYQGILYYTTATEAYKYDGTNTYLLGIVGPSGYLTSVGVDRATAAISGVAIGNTTTLYFDGAHGLADRQEITLSNTWFTELEIADTTFVITYIDATTASINVISSSWSPKAALAGKDAITIDDIDYTTGPTYIILDVTTDGVGSVTAGDKIWIYGVEGGSSALALNSVQHEVISVGVSTIVIDVVIAGWVGLYTASTGELREEAGTATVSTLTGSYRYVYTYYNDADGTESVPCALSNEVEFDGQSASITGFSASSDPQVSHFRLYRIGGNLLTYTYVDQFVDTTVTYVDSLTDASIIDGSILDSIDNDPPPSGLRYIREVYGLFVGAIGNKFYYSNELGKPDYWPVLNIINWRETITGISIVNNNILVHTEFNTQGLSGSNAETFFKYPVSGDQGCIAHDSIVEFGKSTLFLSNDGICLTSGSDVKVISKIKLGKATFEAVNAVLHDEVYYVQLTDNTILVLDMRYEPNLKYYDFGTERLVVARDVLYGRKDGYLNTLFTGDDETYTYKTGKLTEGSSTVRKSYKNIFVNHSGTHTLKVYIDGNLINTYSITDTPVHEHKIDQQKQDGYDIQFELSGIGSVKELEYVVTSGRENG